jgi:hypothetical protein
LEERLQVRLEGLTMGFKFDVTHSWKLGFKYGWKL